MPRPAAPLLVLSLLLAAPAVAQDAGLVAESAAPQLLADGFRFTEGPAADAAGNVYFTDIPNNRIHKWDVAAGQLSTFRENSGAANGLFFNRDGVLYACEGGNSRVVAIDLHGNVKALAESYNDKKFNRPNDLWIDPHGGVYFTDPSYGMQPADIRQGGEHIYYITPGSPTGGKVTRVADDYQRPNGIIGTADGRKLYISDRGGGKTYVYEVVGPGVIANKKLFCEEGSDGMTLDEKGNLYITPPAAAVHVYNPNGKLIQKIALPKNPANICFGGKDHDTLFITARDSFYVVKLKVKGQPLPVQGKAALAPSFGGIAFNWYFDLNTKKYFVGYSDLVPPIPTPSDKHKLPNGLSIDAGVRAYFFACGDCTQADARFVGFMEMYSPDGKQKIDEAWAEGLKAGDTAGMPPIIYAQFILGEAPGQLLRADAADNWVPAGSDAGAAIIRSLDKACPAGDKSKRIRPCLPTLDDVANPQLPRDAPTKGC